MQSLDELGEVFGPALLDIGLHSFEFWDEDFVNGDGGFVLFYTMFSCFTLFVYVSLLPSGGDAAKNEEGRSISVYERGAKEYLLIECTYRTRLLWSTLGCPSMSESSEI